MAQNVEKIISQVTGDPKVSAGIMRVLAAHDLVVTESAYLAELRRQLAAVRSPMITVADQLAVLSNRAAAAVSDLRREP